ncbi:MAG: glucose 1-dehydrogenase [Rhodospirillales bacterium]|jgi:NAD(P)-dependent dehydrogenase (short-subunit alcohol dehydrogenase family)|nr:glucose 1-dehydrogenase [Rhodospirillales bacterium]MDP6883437.1 glucose 1-dehydrogenase [Rhodospirillales bacterium]
MGSLEGKAALVTGASRGIGRVTARCLAGEGCAVFLAADGTAAELKAAAGEVIEAGGQAQVGLFDLARDGAAEAMVEAALAQFKRIDILINNAGIRIGRPFGGFTGAEFDRAVAVNLRAPFLTSQAVVPAMRQAGGGRIIHVASQMGMVASPELALYGLTKAALIHLARSMALELAPDGIIVNAVSPGPIATRFNRDRYAKDPVRRDRILAQVPAGRLGEPDEVAQAILFLATGSPFVNGHNLVIDGGYITH